MKIDPVILFRVILSSVREVHVKIMVLGLSYREIIFFLKSSCPHFGRLKLCPMDYLYHLAL